MTHSTGAENVLDRFKPTTFGSHEYAREELVAELGSALVAQRYGMTKHIKEDSCAYLKGWLDELKESPQFIKTTLLDVKRASSIVTQKVDKIAQNFNKMYARSEENGAAAKEVYFILRLRISKPLTTRGSLTNFEGERRLRGTACAYQGVLRRQRHERAAYLLLGLAQPGLASLIAEDKNFAVVYNGSVGGTYGVMLKYTEQEVRDHITALRCHRPCQR